MKKNILNSALTSICLICFSVVALAATPECQQQQQVVKSEKKIAEPVPQVQTQVNKNGVSFGTIPVFSLLLSPTINALKKATTIFNLIEEEDNSKTSHDCKLDKLVS